VALAAPRHPDTPGDFELRALRLWQRTLCLPKGEPVTSTDLRAVNSFRCALLTMQQRLPHRLAGTWQAMDSDRSFHIECIDGNDGSGRPRAEEPEGEEVLEISGGPQPLLLYGCAGGSRWRISRTQAPGAAGQGCPPEFAEDESGNIRWSDGSCWVRSGGDDRQTPVLDKLGPETLKGFADAAEALLAITESHHGAEAADDADAWAAEPGAAVARWPPRLVPFRPMAAYASCRRAASLAPFDLAAVETYLASLCAQLTPEDQESDDAGGDGDTFSADGSDAEDELPVDASQEAVNEEYMWRLAEQADFSLSESRGLLFVESSIALPSTPTCVDCEQEGKVFSKTQLARHPDERRCQDCIAKSQNAVYRSATGAGTGPAAGITPPAPARMVAGPPHLIGVGTSSQAAICSICRSPLSKQNCSASQKSKPPSRRRCNNCVNAGS